MSLWFSRTSQFLLIFILSMAVAFPQSLFAQDHVVSSADLRKDLQEASAAREKDLTQLDHFFSSEQGQKALQAAHVNYQQVQKGVRSLDDTDLARLSSQAEKAQEDFAAGTISNRDLIWILVGIAALILIIVAVR
ncbi:MAG TPA: hypothetical protein VGI34_09300 [Candidatus Acidoferrales bacterium]|jgi:hypothetical protein